VIIVKSLVTAAFELMERTGNCHYTRHVYRASVLSCFSPYQKSGSGIIGSLQKPSAAFHW